MNSYNLKTKDIFTFIIIFTLIIVNFLFDLMGIRRSSSEIPNLVLCLISFILNYYVLVIVNTNKLIPQLIITIMYIMFLPFFSDINMCINYLLISASLFVLISNFFFNYKYFNLGFLATLSCIFYPPAVIFVVCFFVISIIAYEEKNNITQYIAGVILAISGVAQILYLTDSYKNIVFFINLNDLLDVNVVNNLIPYIAIPILILLYGFFDQINKSNSQSVLIQNYYNILCAYLFFCIILICFFAKDNKYIMIYTSVPISLILTRRLIRYSDSDY